MAEKSIARWREYRATGDVEIRDQLIAEYAPLARRTVDRLQIVPWGCVSYDDLINHAIIGLIDAIDRFDPEVGVTFAGFAQTRIRGAVLDALRGLDWVPRSVRQAESRLRRAYGDLEAILGRPPEDEEVADHLGISRLELEKILTDISRVSVTSLDEMVVDQEGSSSRLDLQVDESAPSPEARSASGAARGELAGAIRDLPERERLVVTLYYYEELTLREIGEVIGVTEQRVSQIHTRAMLRLNHKLTRHEELVAAV